MMFLDDKTIASIKRCKEISEETMQKVSEPVRIAMNEWRRICEEIKKYYK